MNALRVKTIGWFAALCLSLSACYAANAPDRGLDSQDAGHLQVLPSEPDAGMPRPYDYSWLLSLGVDLHDSGVTTPPDSEPVPEDTWGVGASVDVGGDHACALTPQGRLFCWGANFHGQAGIAPDNGNCTDPSAHCQTTPNEVFVPTPNARWTSFSAGHTHTCALADDGLAYCWGSNGSGELGNGTHATSHDASAPNPVPVALGLTFSSIAAGENHSCGIAEGRMYCWGAHGDFELGGANPTEMCLYGLCARTPLQVGDHSDWQSVSAAGQITCGIRGGAIYCWGRSAFDQLGLDCNDASDCAPHEPPRIGDDSDWVSVTTWASRVCALKGDASLWCWGHDELYRGSSQAPIQTALVGEHVAHVATGENHTCAVLQSGALYCWGFDYSGEIGDGSDSPNDCDGFGCAESPVLIGNDYQHVSLGYSFSCAAKQTGAVTCWGDNRYGQVGSATTETCDAGGGEKPCATSPTTLENPAD